MHNRPYDIIVYGATGFTGKLVVEYLIEHYGVNNKLFTWAIAGRNAVSYTHLTLPTKA